MEPQFYADLVKRIPISIIAVCIVVLTSLLGYSVVRGDTDIDIWGIKINPKTKYDATPDIGVVPTTIDSIPIGTVIASLLSPDQMSIISSGNWVLADGNTISTSTNYFKETGLTKIPDLRGVFIRGLNEGRADGFQDPDGSGRNVGGLQKYSVEKHNHSISTAGIWGRSFKGEDGKPRTAHQANGNTSQYGGKETRPTNVALYYYIKIN